MSTIRERGEAPMRVPADLPYVAGALQEAMFDRRALLEAGDALAQAATFAAWVVWGESRGFQRPDRNSPLPCTPEGVAAALAAWKEATG